MSTLEQIIIKIHRFDLKDMAQSPIGGAVKALQLELKKIKEEPVEGFRVKLMNDDSLFEWEVAIFGPPGTMYEGGYFKVGLNYVLFNRHTTFQVEKKSVFLFTL